MACDASILAAIAELVKICRGVGQSIDYIAPTTDLEGMAVASTLMGRVASSVGETPDSTEITNEGTAMAAMTRNIAAILRHVV